eukprot:TRINITY_DN822_c0_g2_i1.p1 TRINITY_DN822_c0_g2~~TRINITY_DN822_c0_g2_i1.p1  ORF type:complete len:261 (+),score=31.23 TRINITY_DN822_c0_g2_i1:68-850(+)
MSTDSLIAMEVKGLDGTAYPVSISRDSLVEDLRVEVFKAGGPPSPLQRLMWKGSPLIDGRVLRDSGLTDGCRVHLIRNQPLARPQVVMKIPETGRIVVVNFGRDTCKTVKDLKDDLMNMEGDIVKPRFFMQGYSQELRDLAALSEYGLQEGGTVRLECIVLDQARGNVCPLVSCEATAPPNPCVQHNLSPDLWGLLESESLTDYAKQLSQAGIRSLTLLRHSDPSDLPADLPKPVKRFLLSQIPQASSCVPSAPPCAPCY